MSYHQHFALSVSHWRNSIAYWNRRAAKEQNPERRLLYRQTAAIAMRGLTHAHRVLREAIQKGC